jgi:hypothetical protein
MASSISAGTTSSTALVCTADTTGALQLATNNGTVAVTVDTSQNVGIGTTSPSAVLGVNGDIKFGSNSSGTYPGGRFYTNSGTVFIEQLNTQSMQFKTNSAEFTWIQGANERMRIDANGRVLVGLTSANTSGSNFQVSQGITFPATQSASSDANTLDDYEEGTWTPSLGGTATYNQQSGTYKKVGGLVYVSAILQVNTLGTGSSNQMSGFPFSGTAGPRNTLAVAYWSGTVGSLGYLAFYIASGTTSSNTIATTSFTNGISDGYGVFQSGTYVMFSGCYHAA